MPDGNIVYMGLTAEVLAAQLDVETTLDDLPSYQQEAAELSAAARVSHPGVRDIAYGDDPAELLDIFTPDGAEGAPVLIDIHGGGWRGGTKNTRSLCAPAVTDAGILWVPIDYGLAPNYTIEQIVDQVRSAVAWVYKNIAQYCGDPERIYVSGNSAGGHLAGAVLMPGWHGDYGLTEKVIKGACAMSGIFDMQALVHASYGYNDQLGMDMDTARICSPLFHLPPAGCPLIVAVGEPEPDEFRRQSKLYYEAWKSGGFETTEIIVPEAHHFVMSRQLSMPESEVYKAVTGMMLK